MFLHCNSNVRTGISLKQNNMQNCNSIVANHNIEKAKQDEKPKHFFTTALATSHRQAKPITKDANDSGAREHLATRCDESGANDPLHAPASRSSLAPRRETKNFAVKSSIAHINIQECNHHHLRQTRCRLYSRHKKPYWLFWKETPQHVGNRRAKIRKCPGFDRLGASSRSLGMTLVRSWLPAGKEQGGAKLTLPALRPGCTALFPSGQLNSFCSHGAWFPWPRKKSRDVQSFAADDGVSAGTAKIRRRHWKPTDAVSATLWASDHSSESAAKAEWTACTTKALGKMQDVVPSQQKPRRVGPQRNTTMERPILFPTQDLCTSRQTISFRWTGLEFRDSKSSHAHVENSFPRLRSPARQNPICPQVETTTTWFLGSQCHCLRRNALDLGSVLMAQSNAEHANQKGPIEDCAAIQCAWRNPQHFFLTRLTPLNQQVGRKPTKNFGRKPKGKNLNRERQSRRKLGPTGQCLFSPHLRSARRAEGPQTLGCLNELVVCQ